ncbi:hypothetical protein GPECTOR_9g523 [Gonium pectorale]|uniref:Uncharacterized protein n=1 Tax=Gonium pectorale TaxID=33097 RepID=A0A150GRL8_GONPE|nr:hypothetical protein GPECTOR_9g523 [Gonium pectorale]|eukprot:KXZ52479.1 hypothetical protein GPECTOR_9g523 [Gonium pectorale]
MLEVTVGTQVAGLAAYLAKLMDRLKDPPAQDNRSVAILLLGIVCTAATAGRGVGLLIRTLLYRASASAAAGQEAGAIRGHVLPGRLVGELLDAVRVLLRYRECGPELMPVHDAIEAEVQAAARGPGGLRLTPEQLIASRPAFWDAEGRPLVTLLQAFAGAAKTTVLCAIVRNFPEYDFLYVVYNKDMQLACQDAMYDDLHRDVLDGRHRSCNFEVRTSHSLAYDRYNVRMRYAGRKIRRVRKHLQHDPTVGSVREFLSALWGVREEKHVRSSLVGAVRKTLQRYMTSADPRVSGRHLVLDKKQGEMVVAHLSELLWRLDGVDPRTKKGERHPRLDLQKIVDAAAALWERLHEPSCALNVPHNAYLKKWALSEDMLRPPCDRPFVVLIDEAQDINAVTKQVLIDKQELPVVAVGDKHQQIYSFNFACGLMAGRTPLLRRSTDELSLRQTFRFGHELAAMANLILKAGPLEPRYMIGRPRNTQAGAGHPGVVYALVPATADLDTVRAEHLEPPQPQPQPAPDQELATAANAGADGAGGNTGGGATGSADRGAQEAPPAAAEPPPPPYAGLRYVQCPLRCSAADGQFPREIPVAPISGVALLPPGFRLPPVAGVHRPWPLVTYIARTNAALVRAALELVALGRSVRVSFKKEHWKGLMNKVRDVTAFLKGRRNWRRGHDLHGLESEEDLQQLVEFEEGDLATAYMLAKEYSLEKVEALSKALRHDEHEAEYYLATTHKMKGGQAPIVQVADDFIAELAPTSQHAKDRLERFRTSSSQVDEINCVYVAATRARSVLLLSRDLTRLALGLHRRHVQLVGYAAGAQEGQSRGRGLVRPGR